jgi:hypothetical protein
MQLAREGILQQGGAASPTIEINNFGGVIVSWEKNGFSQGTVGFALTATLVAGDTVMVSAGSPFDEGATIEYYLNETFVAAYSDVFNAQTPTITSAAGNAYKFNCFSGF